MQTLNISLPKALAEKVDQIVIQEGYASRSEFVRSLLRFYLTTQAKEEIKLLPFKKARLDEISKEMKKTGLYNQSFIKSVVKGLSKSSIYAEG